MSIIFSYTIDYVSDRSDTGKGSATPTTVVVSEDGRIIRRWVGAFWGTNRIGIESFFPVKFPEFATSGSE